MDDSRGLSARLGYRAHPRFAVEVRGDWFDTFDFDDRGTVAGDVDGWSVTGNALGYILTGRFQPYIVLGLGAFDGDVEARDSATGRAASSRDTVPLFRGGAGLDLVLSEYVFLTLEATYYVRGHELRNVDLGVLEAGLRYRF